MQKLLANKAIIRGNMRFQYVSYKVKLLIAHSKYQDVDYSWFLLIKNKNKRIIKKIRRKLDFPLTGLSNQIC